MHPGRLVVDDQKFPRMRSSAPAFRVTQQLIERRLAQDSRVLRELLPQGIVYPGFKMAVYKTSRMFEMAVYKTSRMFDMACLRGGIQ